MGRGNIVVEGGTQLSGSVAVLGAKNAVLPEMVSTLLAPGRYHLSNVPRILDVDVMGEVLGHLGAECAFADNTLEVTVPEELNPEAPLDLVRRMRASILALGVLLARCGKAKVALPGGDDFGTRPIDLHLDGLREMGAEFALVHGELVGRAPDGLRGAEIYLEMPSVGATQNLLLASVLARGRTVIGNAAREPEIQDMAALLVQMGAHVEGAGTSTIQIEGVDRLSAARYRVVPDRLEAGTYLVAGALSRGVVRVKDCVPQHLRMELRKLADAGCDVEMGDDWVEVAGPDRPRAVDFATLPFPGFHTDMHPPMVALLAVAEGTSVMTENVYDARFRYVGELNRMGADIIPEGQHVVIRGVPALDGCEVDACDIRGGAALVSAALRASGTTTITETHHIDRGYDDFVGKLQSLGASVTRGAAT